MRWPSGTRPFSGGWIRPAGLLAVPDFVLLTVLLIALALPGRELGENPAARSTSRAPRCVGKLAVVLGVT